MYLRIAVDLPHAGRPTIATTCIFVVVFGVVMLGFYRAVEIVFATSTALI